MPTKPLPARPSLAHLRHQAKDLVRGPRTLDVCQRLREFHPRFRALSDREIAGAPLQLSDAQLAIAREYGFASWSRLKRRVDGEASAEPAAYRERIADPAFARALDLFDAGDAEGLRSYLGEHPDLLDARVEFEGGNYFHNPALIEFVAENPARNGKLPRNAAQLARTIVEAGAVDRSALDSALDLVASSAVARESGVKRELLDVLCDAGADPNGAVLSALMYGEFDGVRALLERGAAMTLPIAAALDLEEEARSTLADASEEMRDIALALAAQHGRTRIAELLLEAGVDPNRYTPPGGHSHATPLHQAALAGHDDIVELLLARGARTDLRDIHHNATPREWADYAGRTRAAAILELAEKR